MTVNTANVPTLVKLDAVTPSTIKILAGVLIILL